MKVEAIDLFNYFLKNYTVAQTLIKNLDQFGT
jgi:hypothetical protein